MGIWVRNRSAGLQCGCRTASLNDAQDALYASQTSAQTGHLFSLTRTNEQSI